MCFIFYIETIMLIHIKLDISVIEWIFVVVQLLSHVQLCDPMDCSMLDLPVHQHLPELAQTHVSRVSDAIQPFHPLLSPSPPTFNLSEHLFFPSISFPVSQFFASGGQSWNFSFSINPSNEYSGLISFRMDWLDLLALQGTLKSLLQHHSLKALVLWRSAFSMVQLSYPYMTTGKITAWTIWTFVSKIMCLFFNNVSKFVIAFLGWINVLLYWNVSFYQY